MKTDTRDQRTVRMRPATYALFETLQQQLNSQIPYGTVTKAELLDLCVSSASAALAAGELHPGQRLSRDKT